MIITTEGKILDAASEEKILYAASAAMSDYNRIVTLYQHNAMTTQDFIRVSNKISQVFINVINSIKEFDNNEDN